jgi:hypothetical protein
MPGLLHCGSQRKEGKAMNALESFGGSHDELDAVPDAPAIPGRVHEMWIPPATRHEADERIVELSHDIGLILAQLSEDQASWCERTGRSPSDYLGWRRRALFAKAHKEHQLRDCKRHRTELIEITSQAGDVEAGTYALAQLMRLSRRVVLAWKRAGCTDPSLATAMSALASLLPEADDGLSPGVDLRAAPQVRETAQA